MGVFASPPAPRPPQQFSALMRSQSMLDLQDVTDSTAMVTPRDKRMKNQQKLNSIRDKCMKNQQELNLGQSEGFECIDAGTFGHHLCIYECAEHLDTYECIYYVVTCHEITVWTIYILICCFYCFKINYFSMRLTLFCEDGYTENYF